MLQIRAITHAYDDDAVLKGIDLDITQGEIMCLLGPSGCGKTTLLRIIAGLEKPMSGDVLLNGASLLQQPVHTRGFGLMFQDFALFPHMNVAQNVAFGLRMRRISGDTQQRVTDVLELVGLSGFAGRDVTQLSGGEKQRVALARSLAPNPALLMLDEPLGSLDAALRDHLVTDLRAIIRRAGLTAIYVTHDQQEAFAIADRVTVMNTGRIEQIATPQRLYQCPKSLFVARFLNLDNIVPVDDYAGTEVQTALGTFDVDGNPQHILLHPDGIQIAESGIPVEVSRRVYRGERYRLQVTHASGVTLAFSVPSIATPPEVGETVQIKILPDMIIGLAR